MFTLQDHIIEISQWALPFLTAGIDASPEEMQVVINDKLAIIFQTIQYEKTENTINKLQLMQQLQANKYTILLTIRDYILDYRNDVRNEVLENFETYRGYSGY